MKKLFLLLVVISVAACNTLLQAQEMTKGKPGMWPTLIKYKANQPVFDRTRISMMDTAGISRILNNGRLKQVEKDSRGMEHFRYQQVLNGIPVEYAALVVHVSGGKINSQNGNWVKDIPAGLVSAPVIGSSAALQKALTNIGASQYKWQVPAEEAYLKREQHNSNASYLPKGQLTYYSGEQEVSPTALRLAWKFDIYAQNPLSRQLIFVDAVNCKILGKRELIHETNATGTAQTAYSGSQTITTDFTGATYRLSESGRGNGISTFNLQGGTSYGLAVDFTDADNNWNNVNPLKDEYATDAHWGAEKTYDYFFQKYGRNSIDDAGFALNSYVHYSTGYFNAFWDGYRMTYGDGDGRDAYKPLTSLDVCGHEISHGLTEHTSGLIYSYESGALNEGFSDIFGTAIEAFARPTATDWLLGGDFYTIRNMSNPNAFNQPDTYEGTYWYTGGSDYGGVHTNSGVLNYWFYLLTTGGSGTNDHGFVYNVSGLGMDKAAAIAYRLNTHYLVPTSDYSAARNLGILAAEELYGPNSNEAIQTANAWDAVGLYAATCSMVNGLSASPILDRSATVNWNAVQGALNYRVDYRPQNGSTWFSLGTVTTFSKVITGLQPSTTYEWRVRANCNSSFSNEIFTTVAPICNAPGNLSFTVTNSTAVLNWAAAYYAVSYDVEYKAAADNVWIPAGNTTGLTLTLSGLTASTLYDFRIKTNCSFGASGYAQSQFNTGSAPCGQPTGLTNTYNPGLNNLMSWNAVPGAVSYEFQFKGVTGSWNNASTYVVTDTFYALNGIMSGLTLDWRVRTNCGSNYSAYSVSQLNTPCPAPASIAASNITNNSALVSWTPPTPVFNSPFGYTLSYKLSTAVNWATYNATSATSINITGLAPGKVYDCRVRLNCNSFNSIYTQTQFTTLCGTVPSGLGYTTVSSTTAAVKWNPIPGAGSYTLHYKKAAGSAWTTVTGIGTNSFNIGGLTPATAYVFKVQMVCTVGSSAFSPESSFTTYCTSSGNNTQEWIASFKFGNLERYSGADAGGYFNSASTYSPLNYVIGSTGITGFISAGFSAGTKSEFYAVYIDFNRNGSFADAGERIVGPSSITSGTYYFTAAIPATATAGVTGLRVVLLRQPSTVTPCTTGLRGETEDYYVNLTTTAFQAEPIPVSSRDTRVGNSILVSPNPSEGKYSIGIPEGFEPSQYEVLNSNGNSIQKGNIISVKTFRVDITNMPSGIYLLRLTDRYGRREVVKLMKD